MTARLRLPAQAAAQTLPPSSARQARPPRRKRCSACLLARKAKPARLLRLLGRPQQAQPFHLL